ncbi:LacI family DNA-binding transcriptional regulator [Granulosicoccus antarcticus]|uniref:HTH-type transcriptional regulator RafR n=1 Tax=Granulosicoccus antarcticus IMCC3135 TaxID=1192854 RepID=A0A2Z2NR59_9GAMM|nr:LacI family DNA-binding transcriptional regulator [Granulosicoccus antarcticus]ASJ73823.1 HTH-type transcriptional regulator RafR [Granulosicoccus antarcticus IMCC3135]
MKKPEQPRAVTRPSERPTLRTVADACGLAVTTVSRALNNASDIAQSTRIRVRSVADELGYVPNRAGRGLRTGRTHMISLVLPARVEITGYTTSIISSLGEVCRDAGFELSATPEIPHDDELTIVKSIVQNHRADGIVISHTSPQDLRVRYLIENGFPFVTHGRTELASAHASVDFDNERFAEMAANRLAERGRKRLMLVGAPASLTYQTHLLNGFRRSIARNGLDCLEPPEPLGLDMPLDKLRGIITALFRSGNAPDGIVSAGDNATLAIMAGIHDAGLTPGIDAEVVTKQTSATIDHVLPIIDSCFEDITLTGTRLGETLLKLISGQLPTEQLNTIIAPEPRFRLG